MARAFDRESPIVRTIGDLEKLLQSRFNLGLKGNCRIDCSTGDSLVKRRRTGREDQIAPVPKELLAFEHLILRCQERYGSYDAAALDKAMTAVALHQKTLFVRVRRMNFEDFLRAWDAACKPTEGSKTPKARAARASRDEYNVLAREYLKENPSAGPRELQRHLGCGMGTVYKLPAFTAVRGEHKKGRKPKAVSLTKGMESAAHKDDGELARLVGEQRKDQRSDTVRPRERL